MKYRDIRIVCSHLSVFMLAVIVVANGLSAVRMSCCEHSAMINAMPCHSEMSQNDGNAKQPVNAKQCCDNLTCHQCGMTSMMPSDAQTDAAFVIAPTGVKSSCVNYDNALSEAPKHPPRFL